MLSVNALAGRLSSSVVLSLGRDDTLPSKMEGIVVVATAIVTVIAVRQLLHHRRTDSSKALPTPDSTLPILGNTLDTVKYHRHRLHDWLADQSALVQGRPWQMQIVGRPPTVVLTSPDNFEDIVKCQVDNFPRGADSQAITGDFLGRGIIATDGRDWFFQRKVSSHLFSMKMMQEVMHDVVRDKLGVLCNVLDAYIARGEDTISLKRELMHFTSDVFAKIGFGLDLKCLETGLDGETHVFIEAFARVSHVTGLRFQLPGWLWRFKRFFGIGDEGELRQGMKIVNDFTYKVIADSIATKERQQSDGSPPKDLVSLFLSTSTAKDRNEISGGDQKTELEFIRDMAINFIFAGKDTTSVAMGWFVVMINMYPQVLEKIRLEMKEHTPSLFTATSIPYIDELKNLVYLDAAIRENLRLNSPAPSSGRTAAVDTTLSDGTCIKKGSRVMMAMYASARQPTVWGPDASEFKPERWIDSSTNTLRTVSPIQAFVFAAGRRMCPGRNMAMMEMKIALAVLLSRYELTTIEDPGRVTYEIGITHMIRGPFMVNIVPFGSRST
jgi:cytochrome P450